MMDREQMAEDVRVTLADLNGKVREMVLSGNATAGADWAAAVNELAGAYVRLAGEDD